MIRFVFGAVTAIGLVTIASAQQDIIKTRQDLMKRSGQQMGIVNRMARGQDPFDAAEVNAAFDAFATKARRLPTLFPDNTKTGETRALAKIWEDRPGFDAEIAKFAGHVADNRAKATAELDGLKAAVPVLLGDCTSCHEKFRRPQS